LLGVEPASRERARFKSIKAATADLDRTGNALSICVNPSTVSTLTWVSVAAAVATAGVAL